MKRSLILLLAFFLSLDCLFALSTYSLGSSTSSADDATLNVVLEAPSDILNFGFSTTYDSSASDLGLTNLVTKEFVQVKDYDGSGDQWKMRGEMEFYIWWQLFSSNSSYKLTFSISGLVGTGIEGEGDVSFPVSATIGSLGTVVAPKSESVHSYTKGGDLENGYFPVKVTTGDIKDSVIASKKFTSTVTLTLETTT